MTEELNRIDDPQSRIVLTNCPVCGAGRCIKLPTPGHWVDYEVFGQGDWGLERCRSCNLVFTNPRPSESLLQTFYSRGGYSPHESDGQNAAIVQFLLTRIEHYCRKTVAKSRYFLDFGCGGGSLLRQAVQSGWQATGYDIAPDAIESCRSAGLNVTNDLKSLQKGYDAILCSHSLEHVSDFRSVLPVFSNAIMRDTGRLFIAVPNAASLRAMLSPCWMTTYLGANERYHAFPIHLSHFRRQSLVTLLSEYGFEPVAVETYGFGIDSYFRIGKTKIANCEQTPSNAQSQASTQRTSFVKQWIKRAYMSLGWGENLLGVFRIPRP